MFKIVTDSSANLTNDLIRKYDIKIASLSYVIGSDLYSGVDAYSETSLKNFYARLRQKDDITTSCANEEEFYELFKPLLESGNDVLYIGFSSALSATYKNAALAAERLKKEYPARKIITVDSLLASLGEGLLVTTACQLKADGKTIEEVAAALENQKMNVNSLFTVKTLSYLCRGGRISKLNMCLGTVADIKPVMYVNEYGKLVSSGKVIGRKRSLTEIAKKVAANIISPETQTIYISHGDSLDDAKLLAEMISKQVKVEGFLFNYVDPVIAVHSGPDTIAVFFYGNSRVKSAATEAVKSINYGGAIN